MSEPSSSTYYVPENGWYPIFVAATVGAMLAGLGIWLNDLRNDDSPSIYLFLIGCFGLTGVLYCWFTKVIAENHAGLPNAAVKRSYVSGMAWFIFSEVMFFFAFFLALFYARVFAVAWLGGDGAKGITGDYLWPEFEPVWPVVENPDPGTYPNPNESMAAPSLGGWLSYLPFWNTVVLLSSSFTVHWAHTAVKNQDRTKLIGWLGLTCLLGIIFLILQAWEYVHAYQALGLTLASGIYGSTFFILTGFHGFHVTLGTVILLVQFYRAIIGHFKPNDQFGLEAASWYWHFVDVVWVCLFIFVYVI
ncbi:MAG: cytochrome c oxidase subunit 3 [Gammaproteobacteria bacterium]|nr:cytochrome c oxidase subunit 3 [Gammaproteobacteria bacterium]MCY4322661.1 cytochrome c oxidase subunit 3 [Gammaproteobacteria bacterium]